MVTPFPDEPGLYDLQAFAKTLPVGGDYKKLRGAISRLATAGSAHADLGLAATHFAAGVALEKARSQGDKNDALTHSISANFNFALILYARATQTSSNHRAALNVHHRFGEGERRDHTMLFALRNDAVAHFGPGPESVKGWSKDGALLRVSSDGSVSVATPYVRKGHMLLVNNALEKLIPRATDIVASISTENQDVFVSEYRRLLANMPRMKRDLQASTWDENSIGVEGLFARFDQRIMEDTDSGAMPIVHFTKGQGLA